MVNGGSRGRGLKEKKRSRLDTTLYLLECWILGIRRSLFPVSQLQARSLAATATLPPQGPRAGWSERGWADWSAEIALAKSPSYSGESGGTLMTKPIIDRSPILLEGILGQEAIQTIFLSRNRHQTRWRSLLIRPSKCYSGHQHGPSRLFTRDLDMGRSNQSFQNLIKIVKQ